tara:strand:- start:7113 stop:7655 length:543 start_codon:yes stop_codon:yes gene_type:complete
MNIANYITISRIILILPVVFLMTDSEDLKNWLSLILFIIAGITDHLDGFIARKTNTTSSLGALLDLTADKLLIIIPLVYLLSTLNLPSLIVPSLIIILREILITSFRQYLSEKMGRNPVEVSLIAKAKTTVQIIALSFLIISPNFGEAFFVITIFLFWLAAYVSLHSFVTYLLSYRKLIK